MFRSSPGAMEACAVGVTARVACGGEREQVGKLAKRRNGLGEEEEERGG
jgi:hypothetical protein